MSFLQYTDVNPHIHLLIMQKQQRQQTQDIIKERIHHLLQTRRFDELLQEAAKLKESTFPELAKKIQLAKKATQEEKNKLCSEDLETKLAWLDTESNKQQADFEVIDNGQLNIYKLAKIYFDQGQFQKSFDIIKKLQKQLLNTELYTKTTWARLYCEIILQNQKPKKTLDRLKTKLDEYEEKQRSQRKDLKYTKQKQSVKEEYARRKQFLILATLVYFLDSKDQTFQKYVNMCSEEENSAVVQLLCPYIVRYLAVALILNKTLHKNRKYDLFTLIETLRRKVYKESDPFTDFISALHIEFDFQKAKENIAEIRKCVQEDILLKPLQSRIIENCHFLYYKIYCRVYEKVSIASISEMIGKTEEQAQLWILGFIRSLDIEAKIDSVERVVLSHRDEESLNEKYIDLIPKMNSFINSLSQSSEV